MKVKLPVLFALATFLAYSQPLMFGVKGGVPLTGLLDVTIPNYPGVAATTNLYILGPTVELRLPENLAIEFDALYRHFHYRSAISPVGASQQNAWEFPLLLKYRLPGRLVRPYIDGGVAWDLLEGVFANEPTPTQINPTAQLISKPSAGVVIGGGLDFHSLFLHISPEVRYTRWMTQPFEAFGLASNQNQVEFLLGVTF